ncbi:MULTISPECIES: cation diffusion facilitator family transporter [Aeromonas]|uniref:Cation-efflux pump FieF n=2 Tax=Aeromonas TaxID=642 RepID=A0AAW9YDS7_9GAMM|nr:MULTISPECIES: cation diffusion facilitator family transporter [Aeromonas]QIY88117.1 cation diffusion facilitator family transporter [Aeromonas hydrophila]MBS4702054.1 cation diffusion facilitator family transporter [Aeromonas media]MCE9924217.1 cation diffusion facilitator family transporter [Aeromonas media]MDM5087155.1 cation diffusion facilitator family transporter [Aeromonas rivipollensis]MDM5095508.1 cation diffusion facilitator family transporter [Aeromonas rivipollensis]
MSHQHYSRWVTLASTAAVVTATLLILGKLIAWLMTDSSSLLASLTDSFMDVSASIINLLAIRYALAPADEEHRFGHGKAESLAGLIQSAFISGSALLLMMHGISSMLNQVPVVRLEAGIWVSAGSILLTLLLVSFQSLVIRKTNSVAIKADMLHYRSDLLLNAGVLVALVLAGQGWYWADGLFAILIGLFLVWGAVQIGYESVQALLDRQLPEEEQARIMALCCAVEGVHGVHDLRTRQSGPTRFVQLHLELDDQLPLVKAHQIADEAELAVRQSFERMEVIIHMDPISVLTKEQQGTHPEQQ